MRFRGRNKYGNRRVKRGDHSFDSQAEADRYRHLKVREKEGYIADLQVHPRFELLEAFTDRNGKRHRAVVYEADFSYTEDDLLVVEDVKGALTEAFKLKQKFFLARYPEIDLRIVKAK